MRNRADQSTQSRRQELGNKGQFKALRASRVHGRQVGDKPEIMRAENAECGGDKWETSAKSCGPKHAEHPERTSCRKTSPETNVKSCCPRMHPFQRSKNPSQVNLFGE